MTSSSSAVSASGLSLADHFFSFHGGADPSSLLIDGPGNRMGTEAVVNCRNRGHRGAASSEVAISLKDLDRGTGFQKKCSGETIHGSILPEEPGSGSAIKIGSRLIRIGFRSRS